MDQRRLRVLQPARNIARLPEIRVLVDGAWNQTGHVAAAAKDLRERVAERRRRLHADKVQLADVGAVVEPERRLGRVGGDAFADAHHVVVEWAAIDIGESMNGIGMHG